MLTIHGRPNSINVQKVVWIAAEIGLDFDRLDVGGPFGGNDTPEYLAMNPNGRIPTIEDGNLTMWESNAIVRHLAESYGGNTWWPPGTPRAAANQWMDFAHTLLAPMTTVFLGLIRQTPEERDDAAIEAARQELDRLWTIVETALERRPYLTGSTISAGDIPLGCAVYRWYALDMERSELPGVAAWHDRLAARAPFQEHVMLPLT
jgi:glutathione S-transferase